VRGHGRESGHYSQKALEDAGPAPGPLGPWEPDRERLGVPFVRFPFEFFCALFLFLVVFLFF